jgi:transmembrane sensor
MDSVGEWVRAATADYHTGVGEQRLVRLEDGSTIQLNTDTAVNIAFSRDKRDIRLVKGEAAFTVVANPDRPFTVHSQSLHTRALGTIFSVRLHDNRISVTVLEHRVRVDESERSERSPVILKEGEQVFFYHGQGMGEVHTVDTNTESSWQRGKVIFEGKPLAEVVDELNRYRRGRIVILNSTLRPLKVTGVFDVADPDAALRTIHRTLSIHETSLSPYFVLLH